MPVYTVPADEPEATLTVAPNCTDFIADTGTEVPIPSYASLNGSSDSPLVVFQPSTDSEWELWQVSRQSTHQLLGVLGGRAGHSHHKRGLPCSLRPLSERHQLPGDDNH